MAEMGFKGSRRLDGVRPVGGRPPARRVVSPPNQPAAHEPVREAAESTKPHRPIWRRWVWRVALGLVGLILLTGGYLGIKTVLAARHIIVHSSGHGAPALAGSIRPDELKGEGDGRINILLLGVGGVGHDGPELSDTMMVASIDPQTKDVAMLSIPRDLYVKIPGHGYGKINSANSDGGPQLAEQVVQTVLGIPIHYYVVVDFSGFKQAVDAVGGVDVTSHQALNDPTYPCDNNQGRACGFTLVAGQYHMNGALALKYVRCRKGTCGNDFGRSARQQQVLVAIRQRALTLSTLTNPIKISELIDAVGNHVRTDLQLGDIEKLASLIKDIDPSKINQKVLDTSPGGLLVGQSSATAGDILVPAAGTFNYAAIQNLAHNLFVDHYIVQENARVVVENGTGAAGLAASVVTSLQAAHYNVGPAVNAPSPTGHTTIIDYSGGHKPYTINYLQQRFGVRAVRQTPSPQSSASPTTQAPDIVVILGSDYKG